MIFINKIFKVLIFTLLTIRTTSTFSQCDEKRIFFGKEYTLRCPMVSFSSDSSIVGVLENYGYNNFSVKIISKIRSREIDVGRKIKEHGLIQVFNDSRFNLIWIVSHEGANIKYAIEYFNLFGSLIRTDTIQSVDLKSGFLENGDFYLNYGITDYSLMNQRYNEGNLGQFKIEILNAKLKSVSEYYYDSKETSICEVPHYKNGKITIEIVNKTYPDRKKVVELNRTEIK